MKNRKTLLMIVLSLLIAAFLLTACSSDAATEAPAEPVPTEGAADPVAPTAEKPTAEPVDVMPTAAPDEATLTATENVRVRSGPGQEYPIYAKLDGGQTAKLVGISADSTYYAIEIPLVAPNTGWVDANFAEVSGAEDLPVIEAPPVPTSADFVGVQAGDPTIIADDAVFLHSGPGEQYPAYGVAEAGAKGRAIGISEDGNWWVVRVNPEIIGKGYVWVQKEFVSTENVGDDLPMIKTPPVPKFGDLPAPDPNGPYAIALDYLNVRFGPGTYYPVLIVAPPGDSAEITGVSTDGLWWQIRINAELSADERGWVQSFFVDAYNTDNLPIAENPPLPPLNPDVPEGALSCILISQTPEDGTVFEAGTPFDMLWELQNVGEETWAAADSVIAKIGVEVDQPLSAVDSLPLTQDVATEGTYVVAVPMTAPDTAGQFGEYWVITQGEETLCYFYNVIRVEE